MNTMTHPDAYAAGWDDCSDGAPLSPPSELDLDDAVTWGWGWFDYVLWLNSLLVTHEGMETAQVKPCTNDCKSNIKELSKHQHHCGNCDVHLTSLLLCPRCGKRYGDTVYSITKRDGYKTISSGLVRFIDGVAYMAAPCWSHFVGVTEDAVLAKCKERAYETEKLQ